MGFVVDVKVCDIAWLPHHYQIWKSCHAGISLLIATHASTHPWSSTLRHSSPSILDLKVSLLVLLIYFLGLQVNCNTHINSLKISVSDPLCLTDVCRSKFDVAAPMLESIGLPAMPQRVYKWLHHSGMSTVSHFTFSSCFVVEMLDFELYRSNLD